MLYYGRHGAILDGVNNMNKELNEYQPLCYTSSFEPSAMAYRILSEGRILATGETAKQMIERMVIAIFEPEKEFNTPATQIQQMIDEFGNFLDHRFAIMSTPIMNNAGRYADKPLSACTVPPVDLRGDLNHVKSIVDHFHQDGMGTGFSLDDTDEPLGILQFLNSVAVEGSNSGLEDRPVGNMAVLSVHHPKILEFIDAKLGADDHGQVWKFNISVNVSEIFMQAVKERRTFYLDNGIALDAHEVMMKIVSNVGICGDPGLVFIDRLNRDNPTPGVGVYTSTAPCGEVGLTPGESCQFGYINLAKFSDQYGQIDFAQLEKLTRLMTRALDNALEISIKNYAHPLSRRVMSQKRKIGIGICGLADLLTILGLPYDSEEARILATKLVTFINYISKLESHELAKTRGSCGAMHMIIGNRYYEDPGFIETKYKNLDTTQITPDMWLSLGKKIRKTRLLRNASTIALPPTGRSGLVIDASTGVEPLFSLVNQDGSIHHALLDVLHQRNLLTRPLLEEILFSGMVGHIHGIPDDVKMMFQTALEISTSGHLAMVSSLQKAVDESISKTINIPIHSTPEDIKDIYMRAYEGGLKGVTVFKTGSRKTQPRMLAKL